MLHRNLEFLWVPFLETVCSKEIMFLSRKISNFYLWKPWGSKKLVPWFRRIYRFCSWEPGGSKKFLFMTLSWILFLLSQTRCVHIMLLLTLSSRVGLLSMSFGCGIYSRLYSLPFLESFRMSSSSIRQFHDCRNCVGHLVLQFQIFLAAFNAFYSGIPKS